LRTTLVRSRAGRLCAETVYLQPSAARHAVLASTISEVVEQLLARRAVSARTFGGQELDLLAITPPSTRVAVLQEALRLRRSALSAQIDENYPSPVCVRCDARRFARLGMEEAIAEALLHAAARAFVPSEPDAMACVESSLRPWEARQRLRAALKTLPVSARFILGRFRWLGMSLCFGVEVPDAEVGS